MHVPRHSALDNTIHYVHVLFVQTAPPLLSDRFAAVLDGLCRAVAFRMARNPAVVPLLLLLWGRLRRAMRRFNRVTERVRTQTVPHRRERASPTRRRPPAQRLPEGFAWLVRLVPEAAVFGAQLQHLLGDPEMVALLAAAPGAGRILRPLCHMLGAQPGPALLSPPPSRGATAPERPRPARKPRVVAASPAPLFARSLPGLGSFQLPRSVARA